MNEKEFKNELSILLLEARKTIPTVTIAGYLQAANFYMLYREASL